MDGSGRREILKLFGSVPLVTGLALKEATAAPAEAPPPPRAAARKSKPFAPRVFTLHEYATVVVLVDLSGHRAQWQKWEKP